MSRDNPMSETPTCGPDTIEAFDIEVCAITGDPGCLGWPDGYHEGPCEPATATFHRCTVCGNDDVYGEIHHEEPADAR